MERTVSVFLNKWTPKGIFLPFTSVLVDWNLRYSYGPINEFLTKFVAPFVPPAITPNAVTMFSTAMLWPVLWLLARQYFVLAAFLVFIHDMADRLDGSVARARQTSKQSARFPVHDGRLGAFLDAQGDKVFHVGFLIANLLMNNTVWPYKLVAVLVVVAQSVSFVVRCMDYFLPVVGPKDAASDLRAGGEGKLATTLCNAAALTGCLAASGASGWSALSVVLLLLSLDLALRSVKSKLALRAGTSAPPEPDELFAVARVLMAMHRTVSLAWLARALVRRFRPPGTAPFLGTRTALVFQLQGATMLLALPFLYCVKHDLPLGCLAVVFLFHNLMEMWAEMAVQHLASKSITYYLCNQSQFVEYACLRVFGLVCLWSQWAHVGPHWTWAEFSVVNMLLVAHFVYTLALLVIRFDDTMPQHPAMVASWARLGGPGAASGTNSLGVLRDRLRPIALMLMTLSLGMERGRAGGELWSSWYGVGAVVTFAITCAINHIDLVHKMKVRGVAHKLSRETLSTLAPQDESLQVDRSANPPPYDIVVTIGCFDLFHEGHVK